MLHGQVVARGVKGLIEPPKIRSGHTSHLYIPACSLLQTHQTIVVQLLQSTMRLLECPWLQQQHKSSVEACIRTLAMVGKEPRQRDALSPTGPEDAATLGCLCSGSEQESSSLLRVLAGRPGEKLPGGDREVWLRDVLFLNYISRRDQGGVGITEAWAWLGDAWCVPAAGEGPGSKASVYGGFPSPGLCPQPTCGCLTQAKC